MAALVVVVAAAPELVGVAALFAGAEVAPPAEPPATRLDDAEET